MRAGDVVVDDGSTCSLPEPPPSPADESHRHGTRSETEAANPLRAVNGPIGASCVCGGGVGREQKAARVVEVGVE